MPKVLRVGITDEEWEELKPLLTRYGELSFIMRRAIRAYIKDKREKEDVRGDSGKGRGIKQT